MMERTNSSQSNLPLGSLDRAKALPRTTEVVGAAKKRHLIDALTVVGIFLLGILLPPSYKAFVPFLFVIPAIFALANKVRQAGGNWGSPQRGRTYPPPDGFPSHELYTYKPKDSRNPRRYKPIG